MTRMGGVPADPSYPGRPTHHDFLVLCEVAQTNDNLAELFGIEPLLKGVCDEGSLAYLARSRAAIACERHGLPLTVEWVSLLAACIVDGFAVGHGFTVQRMAEDDEA